MTNGVGTGVVTAAMALAVGMAVESAAQVMPPSGFTQESFALLKQRAEAGDAKAQELYNKVLASNSALDEAASNYVSARDAPVAPPLNTNHAGKGGMLDNYADALAALDSSKADIRKAEAGTGVVTADMLAEVSDALVVNGFYVGMPIEDALARLVRVAPGRKVRRRPDDLALAEEVERCGLEGIWLGDSEETFCLAKDGRVVRILIPPEFVGDWLGLGGASSDCRAAELAMKFKSEARSGKSASQDMQDLAVEVACLWLFGICPPEKPSPSEERAVLNLAGQGLDIQDDQVVYQYGVVKGSRVTFFGAERENSDAGITRRDGKAFLDGWLKMIRALGEYPVEGTLRLDDAQFRLSRPN